MANARALRDLDLLGVDLTLGSLAHVIYMLLGHERAYETWSPGW